MNTEPTTDEQQRVIAQVAADYTPPEPQSHTLLMPHRESIATLRSKGASFRTIVSILGQVNVRVSLDTLSRFCRETIDQKPVRKGRRRSADRAASGRLVPQTEEPPTSPEPQTQPDSPPAAPPEEPSEPTAPPRGKGPRIADPSNI